MTRMQTYWDLNEKERAALAREEVERFLDAELMTKGVLKVDPFAEEPVPSAPEPSRLVYRIRHGGFRELDCVFETVDAAHAFLANRPAYAHTEWLSGSSLTVVAPLDSPEVFAVKLLTAAEMAAAKSEIQRAQAAKAANERRRKEHEEAMRKQDEALQGLWDDWHACRERADRMERIGRTFEEYTRLAGDEGTAARFLVKAYPADAIAAAAEWLGVAIPAPPETIA